MCFYGEIWKIISKFLFLPVFLQFCKATNEPPHDKTNKMAFAPSKDSDLPGHPHEESLGP